VPFGLIGPALRRTAGVLSGEPADVQRRKLRARAGRHLRDADRGRVAEFLGEIAGVPFADDDSVQLRAARSDRQLMADQVRRAWEDFIEAECAVEPVVLVLEDLHWGDRPSVQLVDAALGRVERRPLLVLALGRPELEEVFPRLFGGRVGLSLDLRPLGRPAAERLTRLALGDAVEPALMQRIVDLAGGNAFFLEGLIRAASKGQGDALPETIIATVEGRFEGIDPGARRVLRAASIFGEVFREGGVAALLAEGREKVRAHLADLERLEVVTPRGWAAHHGDREHAFQHALLREAAYAMLTESDRVLGHLHAGRWLLREGEPSAAIVADHFARGEDEASAAEHYRRAAEHALAADDLQAAIELSERGLACGAAGELGGALRLLQAEARSWRGELDEAERAVVQAAPWLPRGQALHYRGVEVLAVVYGVQSKRAELAALAGTLLDEGDPAADPRAYAAALARVAAHLVSTGPSPQTALLLARLDASIAALGEEDPAFAARAHHVRAVQAAHGGDPGEYLRCAERALECFERIGDLRNACVHRMNVGDACRELGVYPRAEASLAEALEVAERMKLHTFVAAAKLNLGQVLACRGAFAPAGRLVREAADQASALGYRRMLGAAKVYLARILLSAGDPAAAAVEAEAAARATSALPSLLPLAREVLARIRLAEGDPRGALTLAREAVERMTAAGFVEEGEARIRLTLAEALHAEGRLAEAREALGVARDRLLAAAERIHDRELVRSFLEEVHESARTLELWRAWG
jgi:tetratricopeptide (TPR) repeat protein